MYIISKAKEYDNIIRKTPIYSTSDKAEADAYVAKYKKPHRKDYGYSCEYLVIDEVETVNMEINPWQEIEDEYEQLRQKRIADKKRQIENALAFKSSPLYQLMTEWNGNPDKIQPVCDYIDAHPDCPIFYETEADRPKGESFTYMGTAFKVKSKEFDFGNWFLYYKDKFDFDDDFNNFIDKVPQEVREWYEKLKNDDEFHARANRLAEPVYIKGVDY